MLTVLLATCDRPRILQRSLDAYRDLVPPDGGWKMVVVDNAGTDETRAVVDAAVDRLPVEYVRETRRGKNHALNRGLRDVVGDLVVLTDDDILPDPRWLLELESAAARRPDFDLFGGIVEPVWPPGGLPDWFSEDLPVQMLFAQTRPDLEDGEIPPERIFGPNMAVRRRVFDEGLRFDPSIGPAGEDYAMGSETEFCLRAGDLGYRAWFHTAARVGHIIRPEQMEREAILRRARRSGRGMYRLDVAPVLDDRSRRLFGVPLYILRRIAHHAVRVIGHAILGRRGRAFASRVRLAEAMGIATEARRSKGGDGSGNG